MVVSEMMRRQWLLASITPISALATSVLICALSLSANLSAKFGPIDDHEPLSWMGYSDRVEIGSFLDTLINKTELGSFGDTTRFRPIYYFYRIGQATIFGTNTPAWYLSVLLLFVVTLTILAIVTTKWIRFGISSPITSVNIVLSFIIPVFAVALFTTMSAWSGVVTRLGPSELLAVFGTSILLLGITQLLVTNSNFWWIAVATGSWIAVLSKESFLPLTVVPFIILIYRLNKKPSSYAEILYAVLASLPVVFVIAALYSTTVSAASDVYGQSVDTNRLVTSIQELSTTFRWYWLPAAVLVLSGLTMWIITGVRREKALILTTSALVIFSFFWLIFDSWVYSGKYELTRYWMVFELLKILWIISSVVFAVRACSISSRSISKGISLLIALAGICYALLVLASLPIALNQLRNESELNANATHSYQSDMQRAEELLRKTHGVALIIVNRPGDYEPTSSIVLDLKRKSAGATPVFIQTKFPEELADDPLAKGLQGIAYSGSRWGNSPIGEFQTRDPVVCLYLNADPGMNSNCDPATSVRINARGM